MIDFSILKHPPFEGKKWQNSFETSRILFKKCLNINNLINLFLNSFYLVCDSDKKSSSNIGSSTFVSWKLSKKEKIKLY